LSLKCLLGAEYCSAVGLLLGRALIQMNKVFPLPGSFLRRANSVARNTAAPPFPACQPRHGGSGAGFSLVELLVVVAIISLMAGLLSLALQGMRAPAVRGAASQVTSGLGLARQVAITKNTKGALFIATDTANGRIPNRHWAVGYLDKSSGNWILSKKWEPLPEGAVFLETLMNSGYTVLAKNNITATIGEPFIPTFATTISSVTIGGATLTSVPLIMFSSDGTAISGNAATPLTNAAIRIASGLANTNGEVTLTSTDQYYFVETDGIVGRIRMRTPESYK